MCPLSSYQPVVLNKRSKKSAKMRMFLLLSASIVTCASAGAPSCASKGQSALCKDPCASTCRGFPPGFASPGCVDETDCTNPPGWYANKELAVIALITNPSASKHFKGVLTGQYLSKRRAIFWNSGAR